MRSLLLALALILGAPPTSFGPETGGRGGGNSGGGGSANPVQSVTLACTPDTGTAPFSCQATVSVGHSGTLGQAIYSLDCGNGDDPIVSPPTFGTALTPFIRTYAFEGTCDYVTADTYHLVGELFDLSMVSLDSDTADIIVAADTTPEGSVALGAAVTTEDTCESPCSDLGASFFAYNGDTSYTYKHDADDSCATPTTDCADACWTTISSDADGLLLAGALPDFTGVGIKQLRMCVLDERPSSAFTQYPFEVTSSAVTRDFTLVMSPASSATSPTNDVAMELDCTGNGCTAACDVEWDCNIAASGSASTIYTNGFETTGAAGCDDRTSQSGVWSCAGGSAQVGDGTSATNAVFFHNAITSQPVTTWCLDDINIITDSPSVNQRRFNLRDDSTNKVILETASPTANSLRLTCPTTASCTTAGSQYVDGTPFDVCIEVTAATGRSRLLTPAGAELCVCEGTAAADVDGFVLNGGQGVIGFNGVTVATPGAAADPTPLVDNTTWPFNTQTEATENCDGYTTGTTTAQAVISCPDSETVTKQATVQITAAPTFSIDTITTNIGTTCTIPDCIVGDISFTYSGTATGTVSAIACTLSNGANPAVLTTTTDAVSPFSLKTEGGWGGFTYDDGGTYAIRCQATREGVTNARSINLVANEIATPVSDLQIQPVAPRVTVQPNSTPPALPFSLSSADDSAIPFSCVERIPRDWFSLNTCCGTTPLTLTGTHTQMTQAGTFCADIDCRSDDNRADTATSNYCVTVSAPQAGLPPYIASKDATGTRIYTGKIGSSPTILIKPAFDNVPGLSASRFFNSEDVPSTVTDSHMLRNSKLLGSIIPVGSSSNPDIINVNNGTNRQAEYWLLRSLEISGARFAFTGPHSDLFQTVNNTCAYIYKGIFFQGIDGGISDSGQVSWTTNFCNQGANTLQWYVMQDVDFTLTAGEISACEARRAAACTGSSCTYNCDGRRVNVAFDKNQSGSAKRWFINAKGITVEGGDSSNPSTGPFIMVPPPGVACSTYDDMITSSFIPAGVRKCYVSIEAALAAGEQEPPFIRHFCGGWANSAAEAPNCISTVGYVSGS